MLMAVVLAIVLCMFSSVVLMLVKVCVYVYV